MITFNKIRNIILLLSTIIIFASNTEDIPAFYQSYFNEKLSLLTEYESSTDSNGDSFIFITDTHTGINRMTSASLIRGICSGSGINKIFFGGDVIAGHGSEEDLYNQINRQFTTYNDYLKPYATIYNTRGNHDFVIWSSAKDTVGYTAPDEVIYRFFMKDIENKVSQDLDNPNSLYYYHDNQFAKIRYIHLDTSEDSSTSVVGWGIGYGLSQNQYDWLIRSLHSLPSGWNVIILSHIPVTPQLAGHKRAAFYVPLKGLLEAFQNASVYNYSGTIGGFTLNINVDFKTNTSKIICVLGGHLHKDRQKYENGILHIVTTCDSPYSQDGIKRTEKTINESSFDACLIDVNNKVLRFVRFGAGYNRTYHYNTPLHISAGETKQITSELIGALAYLSSDTMKATVNNSGVITGVVSGDVMITATDAYNNKEFFEIKIDL
jgi:hypothetical protein